MKRPIHAMTKQDIEYAVIKNLVRALAVICAANPEPIIDLLTGYLWDDEEAEGIKKSTGNYEIDC